MKNSIEYLDKITKIIEVPYFYELKNYGIDDLEEWEYVFSKIYCDKIISFKGIGWNECLINGRINKYIEYRVNDLNGNMIYFEDNDGDWVKIEYDKNGYQIYWENSQGKIVHNR